MTDAAFHITQALTTEDHEQIVALQRRYHASAVDPAERSTEGFVSLEYTPELLDEIRGPYRHIVAKADGRVVAYALVMLRETGKVFPELDPMFALVDAYCARRFPGQAMRYVVMGQVCVDRPFRGSGAFRALYEGLRETLSRDFDFIATEVAHENRRSMQAHARIGFVPVTEEAMPEWATLAWHW